MYLRKRLRVVVSGFINQSTLNIIFVMRIEARETARLYQVLSDKLGTGTAEAMFKYIDGKTENNQWMHPLKQ